LVFYPSFADIDISSFVHHDCKEFHCDVKEAILPNVPKLRVKDVDNGCLFG